MNEFPAQQRLIAALRDPARSPLRPHRVRLIETHISWVLLAGKFAYKIKKAVNLEFLDFSTLAARRFYCEEELRINRRLAPQLYLDVIPIGGSPEQPTPGGDWPGSAATSVIAPTTMPNTWGCWRRCLRSPSASSPASAPATCAGSTAC